MQRIAFLTILFYYILMYLPSTGIDQLAAVTNDRLRLRLPGFFVGYGCSDAKAQLDINRIYLTFGEQAIEEAIGASSKHALSAARGILYFAWDEHSTLRCLPWIRSDSPNPLQSHKDVITDLSAVTAKSKVPVSNSPITPYPDMLHGQWLRGPSAQVFACGNVTDISDQHVRAAHEATRRLPERPASHIMLRQFGQNLFFDPSGSVKTLSS